MRIAVVTDSTAFFSEKARQYENLFIMPIPFVLDGTSYNEGIDITSEEFFKLLKKSKDFPTTSQPVMGKIIELYQNIAKQGYEAVISIHLSSGISGTIMNLNNLASEMEEIAIYPFDSLLTSLPMGNMVEAALEMSQTDLSPEEIIKELEFIRENTGAYIIVDDLNNLVRGGRLTNGAALIGSLLKIKPVLTFDNGKIVVFEKIRTARRAFQRMEDLLEKVNQNSNCELNIFIIHANNLEKAKEEKEILLSKYPDIKDIQIGYFGPVIGTHLGERAVAFGWSAKHRK